MTSPQDKQQRLSSSKPFSPPPEAWGESIAIIGMSARFPQSRNVQEFWNHLVAGDVLIENLDEDTLRRAGVSDATLAESSYIRRGNVIEDADAFDAEFFGLSRREAEILDPQQRVFLECAWEALENAGHTGEGDKVGVFAGAGMNTYVLQLLANPATMAMAGGYQLMLANDKDFLATRVAYKLDLRGPAVTIQTACSTSLAAVHVACCSLLKRECSMALAGGVSVSFPQGTGYSYVPGMILSPDGYCRPFDVNAGGTVPGRGAGVIVLKRLSEAVADGDSIVAVIRGSAWNNDGAGKVGYTAPSIDGQAEVIRASLAAAGIDSSRVGYVETHGTATELGDAIELAALTQVFGADKRDRPLILGAVKANTGHADAAAGIAGLMKASLALQSGLIPPTPTFMAPNPVLNFENTPFQISSAFVDWTDDLERWAGVSSFGIGGTNVHVTLSAAPASPPREDRCTRPRIFPVSAKSLSALNSACEQVSKYLAANTGSCFAADVAKTLQSGRRAFGFRRAVVAESCGEAADLLQKPQRKPEPAVSLERNVIFLFPGQGQQFPGMTEALYRQDRVFAQTIDGGCALLREQGLDLQPFLGGHEKTRELCDRFRETELAQPALVLVEYALALRLRSLGIEPRSMLGHSLGELTAACVAGVFSFEDALLLALQRGRLMSQTAPGLMLAVMLPPEILSSYLVDGTWLAAENGPKMSVASGPVDAVEELERRLMAERVATVRLASKNAFHTPLMADAAKAFRGAVAAVKRNPPSLPWLSNVTGTWITVADAQDPQYWANQILSPVRFTRCLAELAQHRSLLVEVGPGEALLGIARQQFSTSVMVPCLGAENRQSSDAAVFYKAVATAWECGEGIRWNEIETDANARRVPLPTYPFERQRHLVERTEPKAEAAISQTSSVRPSVSNRHSSEKRDDISSWFYAPSWRSTPPANLVLPARPEGPECWLVLAGEDQFSDDVVSALRAKGHTVVWLSFSSRFAWHEGRAKVNPSSASELELLWKRIDELGWQPSALLSLPGEHREFGSRFDAIVSLIQAAGERRRHLRRFEFITSSSESVIGETVTDPEGGELRGLATTIPVELGASECRCIDVELSGHDSAESTRLLLEEFHTIGRGLTVAYRRGARWQKEWAPALLKHCSQAPFRERGVYLITGGVGGIGKVVARHLLSHFDARVVVVGRTALPDHSEWQSWIAENGEENKTSMHIRHMQALEGAGGQVVYMAAHVTDIDGMRSVVERTESQFGKLNGVFHAAGVAGGSRIVSQSVDEAREIRSSKVHGSRVLAELLGGSNIDFLLLFSSFSAYFPAPSQSAYAAANAFQNSFAEYCRGELNIPAIAIAFGAWREVGMSTAVVVPEGLESYYDERMRRAMTNDEGIEVIHRVLGQWRGAQILTSTVDLETYGNLTYPTDNKDPVPSGDLSSGKEIEALNSIVQIWKDLLGVDSVSPSDNFFNLGGHSLMATMMISRMREQLGVSVTLRDIFEAQTPERLAEVVRLVDQRAGFDQRQIAENQNRELFEI